MAKESPVDAGAMTRSERAEYIRRLLLQQPGTEVRMQGAGWWQLNEQVSLEKLLQRLLPDITGGRVESTRAYVREQDQPFWISQPGGIHLVRLMDGDRPGDMEPPSPEPAEDQAPQAAASVEQPAPSADAVSAEQLYELLERSRTRVEELIGDNAELRRQLDEAQAAKEQLQAQLEETQRENGELRRRPVIDDQMAQAAQRLREVLDK